MAAACAGQPQSAYAASHGLAALEVPSAGVSGSGAGSGASRSGAGGGRHHSTAQALLEAARAADPRISAQTGRLRAADERGEPAAAAGTWQLHPVMAAQQPGSMPPSLLGTSYSSVDQPQQDGTAQRALLPHQPHPHHQQQAAWQLEGASGRPAAQGRAAGAGPSSFSKSPMQRLPASPPKHGGPLVQPKLRGWQSSDMHVQQHTPAQAALQGAASSQPQPPQPQLGLRQSSLGASPLQSFDAGNLPRSPLHSPLRTSSLTNPLGQPHTAFAAFPTFPGVQWGSQPAALSTAWCITRARWLAAWCPRCHPAPLCCAVLPPSTPCTSGLCALPDVGRHPARLVACISCQLVLHCPCC